MDELDKHAEEEYDRQLELDKKTHRRPRNDDDGDNIDTLMQARKELDKVLIQKSVSDVDSPSFIKRGDGDYVGDVTLPTKVADIISDMVDAIEIAIWDAAVPDPF